MSKRFFSLLLVLVMALSFAAPAFAANDGIATIGLEDFDNAVTNGTAGQGHKSLQAELKKAAAPAAAGKDHYRSETWTAFDAAYTAANNLKRDYNSGTKHEDKEMQDAATTLAGAYAMLNSKGTDEDKAAVEALIKEAEELTKKVPSAAGEAKSNLDAAILKWKTTKANDWDITKDESYFAIHDSKEGALVELQAAIDAAKPYASVVTASLSSITYTEDPQSHDTKEIAIKIAGFDSTKDQNKYLLTLKLNKGPEVIVKSATEFDNDSTKIKNTGEYDNIDLTPVAGVTIGSAGLSALKTALGLTPPSDKFTKDDTLTATLYYWDDSERETDVGYWHAIGNPVTTTCAETPASPVTLAGQGGFVAMKDAKNAAGKQIDVKGNVIASDKNGNPVSVTADDSFYIALNKSYDEIIKKDERTNYTQLYWKVTSPTAAGKTVELTSNITPSGESSATFGAGITKNNNQVGIATLIAGTYKFELVAMEKIGGESGDHEQPVTLLTVSIELPTLDKTPLSNYLAEKKLSDLDNLAKNFGPYDQVTALMQVLADKNDGIVSVYLKASEPALATNVKELGAPVNDKKQYMKDTVNCAGCKFQEVDDAMKSVYSLVDLKAKLDELNAMDPDSYKNWDSGIMAETLAIANDVYAVVTAKNFEAKCTTTTSKDKISHAGEAIASKLGIGKAMNAYEQKDIDALLKALQTAQDTLQINEGAKTGLEVAADGKLYLYKAGQIQKTGYTEWPVGSGIYYYFSVKDGHALRNGVVQAAGTTQYVANAEGVLQTGYVKVGSDAYYCSVKDHHIMKNGIVSAGGTRQYIAGKDGKLLKDKQTVGSNSYYCSVKDHHIFKAIKNTAWVTGTVAKYQVNAKGVILATKPLKG